MRDLQLYAPAPTATDPLQLSPLTKEERFSKIHKPVPTDGQLFEGERGPDQAGESIDIDGIDWKGVAFVIAQKNGGFSTLRINVGYAEP